MKWRHHRETIKSRLQLIPILIQNPFGWLKWCEAPFPKCCVETEMISIEHNWHGGLCPTNSRGTRKFVVGNWSLFLGSMVKFHVAFEWTNVTDRSPYTELHWSCLRPLPWTISFPFMCTFPQGEYSFIEGYDRDGEAEEITGIHCFEELSLYVLWQLKKWEQGKCPDMFFSFCLG